MSILTMGFLAGFIGIAFIYLVYSINRLIKNGQVPLEVVHEVNYSKMNPSPNPKMDLRMIFGCTVMVRDFVKQSNGDIHITHWMGPVDITGYDNRRHVYLTAFGDFCDARLLTEEEKNRHARNWEHSLKLVEGG